LQILLRERPFFFVAMKL